MSLYSDLKNDGYIDAFGLVSPTPAPPSGAASGNGVLYSALAMLIEARTSSSFDCGIALHRAIRQCFVRPGLLVRYPGDTNLEAQDDYIGACSAYVGFASDVVAYGQGNKWCFNNLEPGKWRWDAWLGRYPAFIAHARFSASEPPSFFQRLGWAASMALSGRDASNTSDIILAWVMVNENLHPTSLGRAAIALFKKRVFEAYPDGMRGVLAVYFGPTHPLTRHCPLW